MNHRQSQPHRWEAWLWFVLAALTALFTILLLPIKAPFAVPGMLGLAVVLLLRGRQCVPKWRLAEDKYNQLQHLTGFVSAILCALGIVLPLAMT